MSSETEATDLTTEAVAALLRGRRTTNLFEPEPVGVDVLLEAVEVARWAPNHRLTEPWRFYVLGPESTARASRCWADFEAETRGEKVGAARLARLESMPGHFVLTSLTSEDAIVDRENYAACCCAIQNLMLYLWQRGVGVKWATGAITREQRFYDVLGIDSTRERIVGYFWYGKPKLVGEQKRRDVSEIAFVLP